VAEELNFWTESELLYQEAIEINAHFVLALECLGQLWFEREDLPREECLQHAKQFFLNALNEERNERILTCLGAVYSTLDQHTEAKSMFEEALRINPFYEEAMLNLAGVIGQEEPNVAVDWLNRAIEIDPNYSAAHRELGVHLVRKRDLLEGEYHLRRALQIDPADYWAHMQLANALGVQGKNVEAEQVYRFATSLHPDIKDGILVFARFLDSIGKRDDADIVRRSANP
jgi:tetratricopeptide (TPR) repeat protein